MLDPRKQRFAPYLRRLADMLALKDWDISIDDRIANDGSSATIWCSYGQRVAKVGLSEWFLDQTPDRQRKDLIHELIHCHMEPAWETATDALPDVVCPIFKRHMEYAIDALAVGIAPLLPLPDAGD